MPRAPVDGFHELPLVAFTALGTAGAGIGVANLLEASFAGGLPALSRPEGILLCVLLGAGLLVSSGHLGKPLRGPLALRRLGRSALSNEILALGSALVGGILGVALPPAHPLQGAVDLVACVGALSFLLALGAVYNLPGQLAWRGPALLLHPVVMGAAWGLQVSSGRAWASGDILAPPALALWLALVADGLLFAYRWRILERRKDEGELSHPRAFRWRRVLLGARFTLASVATPLALMGPGWGAALFTFSLALLLDRFAFYTLAVRLTTESEVARVEALLGIR